MLDSQQVENLIIELLEQHAFLDGDPITGDELPESLEDGLSIELHFHNSQSSGVMRLGCPNSLASEIAASVLGLDGPEEASEEDAHDAIAELVNVIAGQVLTVLASDAETFSLNPPALERDADGTRWDTIRESQDGYAFLIEDCPAMVTFSLKQAA